jgi:hypothetical protein
MDAARTPNEQAVDRALERFARTDATYRTTLRAVLMAQKALQRVVTIRAWNLYLALDEAVNAHHGELINAAIRLALLRGKRSARSKKKLPYVPPKLTKLDAEDPRVKTALAEIKGKDPLGR